VAQATGRKGDVRDPERRRMTGEQRSVFVKHREIVIGEAPKAPKRSIERSGGVALREDEHVVRLHVLVENDEHSIDGREVAADVPDARLVVHL